MVFYYTSRVIPACILSLLLGFPALAEEAKPTGISSDLLAPHIYHQTQTHSRQEQGKPVEISAVVQDDDGVAAVILYYRTIGDEEYARQPMQLRGADEYVVTIAADYVEAPGLEYYIQAEDKVGNMSFKGATFSPIQLSIKGGAPGTAVLAVSGVDERPKESMFSGNKKWYWVAAGVLLTGAIYASQSGDGDKGSDDTTVTISGKLPE